MDGEPVKATQEGWDPAPPTDTWRNYAATGRLAILLAGVTFCVIFLPLTHTQWGLPLATLAAYSVLVFGLALRDKNCSIRRPQVREQLPKFLLMHVPFLLAVYWLVAEWRLLTPNMPHWLTAQDRKGSLYEWLLITSLALIAWWQEHWIRSIVRRSLNAEDLSRDITIRT